jgi:hypothetical protein
MDAIGGHQVKRSRPVSSVEEVPRDKHIHKNKDAHIHILM